MRGSATELDLEFSPVLFENDSGLIEQVRTKRAWLFEWTTFGIFAATLALLTLHHEMWRDELQAWLIARDTHSLSQLVHVLHYEGHPALWYLLLWIPTHFSANPAGMQVINFLVSVSVGWLIVSAQMLPRHLRVLLVFSFYIFYQYGVTARSYALAMLLLIGAARCLSGVKQHRRLAILLLALSINTHALAAPVAVALAAWALYFDKVKRWRDAGRYLRDREFLTALVSLAVAGILALITVWPARDIDGPYSSLPFISNFKATTATLWLTFVPRLPSPLQIMLTPLRNSIPASCALSIASLVLAAMLLRGIAARIFLLSCALLEITVIALTLGAPSVYHLGFIFIAFVVALMLDPRIEGLANPRSGSLSHKITSASILLLLLLQIGCSADASVFDWLHPYSDAKEASAWLRANHLDRNPLVLQPSESATGIVAYLERPDAYYPSCRCYRSYELRNASSQTNRMATPQELKMVRGSNELPVILVSNRILKPGYLRNLGLTELHSTSRNVVDDEEIFHIYEQVRAKPDRTVAAAIQQPASGSANLLR
jgi:hypothetical protein